MQLGIIGLPQSGKSTVFDLLTSSVNNSSNYLKSRSAIARVPDERIEFLSNMYKPKKTTYAQMNIVDIPGLVPGTSANVFLESIRQVDALLYVLRAFHDKEGNAIVDPVGDFETINYELLLSDLDLVERRIEKIKQSKKKIQSEDESTLLESIKICLEDGKPISSLTLSEAEQDQLQIYNLLTTKPILICVNISENDIGDKNYDKRDELLRIASDIDVDLIELSAAIEQEIAGLEGDDKQMFMDDVGITEAGITQVSRIAYKSLGLIAFFTVGEDEVKAWNINKNTVAKSAAGKIHTDIERGFIRAEVVAYEHLREHGSMNNVKEKGLMRLEGKEYIVNDGDIVHFRFNV